MIHHRIESPLSRKGKTIINIFSFIFQKISFYLIKKFSNEIFVYNNLEGKKINKLFNNKASLVQNGINNYAKKIKFIKKKYDICFVGGLRESKGIFDFIKICISIKQLYPNLKVIIIGKGTIEIENHVRKLCYKNKFSYIPGLTNFKLLKKINQSKILLSTSREEGWGIVVVEAMATFTIGVGKFLPAYKKFKNKCFFFNDDIKIVNKIIYILNNTKIYDKLLIKNKSYSNNFLWQKVLNVDYKKFNHYFV
jgi:glycosyltransferase involved in cell wall biosynthesis